ncbi:hypothetical protein [Hydrogenophaga sp.]|uniref:hypothetical protein n=1 Tax=Hydrogenophaga sp. TaxID=1904254 RepID=UPI003F71E7DB
MNPDNYDLQHTDIPQPKDVDDEVITRDWPMPNMTPWAPKPQPTLLERIRETFR